MVAVDPGVLGIVIKRIRVVGPLSFFWLPVCLPYKCVAEENKQTLMTPECDSILAHLQQRFSSVSLRTDGRYEINRRILLSTMEAQALIDDKASLEEIVIYRNVPPHRMPERIRRALYHTSK